MEINKKDVPIDDLRSALEYLKNIPGQYVETDVEADPHAEISGIYRHVGAGGTVMRPTKLGPAMVFNNVKGHPDAKVAIGVLSSRERVAHLFGCAPEHVGYALNHALGNLKEPIVIPNDKAKCQEVIYKATDPGFDVGKLVPAPTNTEEDAGPYITMGLVYASDPETGESDVTIHRMCIQGKDEITFYSVPGSRHIGAMREKAERMGKPLPISISIGVDPAIYIAACFEPPTTPFGFNELTIAGGLRNKGVELTNCLTVNEKCIANAEYVIEGELLPDLRMREDINTDVGKAMPEFPGYNGPANPALPIIKVKAVTTRKNPIMQSCIGPSEEHVSMAGIPTEASIIQMVNKAIPGRLLNVYAHSSGGGKYVAVLQFKKNGPMDEGRQRQAALLAFAAFSELKHVFLVSEDVDPFDSNDVLWAMTTRFQADKDIIMLPNVMCHPLDPSNNPDYDANIMQRGLATKAIFDCTIPFAQNARFERAKFKDLDASKWVPNY